MTLGVGGDVEPPGPGQAIVRALGSRGSNIIEASASYYQPISPILTTALRLLGCCPMRGSPLAAPRQSRGEFPTWLLSGYASTLAIA